MRNFDFAPFQGLKPTPSGRISEAQDQGNQGIARPAYRRREQANPQIDADIVEKGHFWMETN
jgi:hypothetical protein